MLHPMQEILLRIGQWQEKGQSLLEYALIIALIALAVIAAMQLFGTQIAALYNQITF